MIKRTTRFLLVYAFALLPFLAYGQNRPSVGQPLRWEYLVVVIGILFIIFRFFGVKKQEKDEAPPPPMPKAPPPPPPMRAPSAPPLMVQASEAIGELKEVGKNVKVGGKRMSSAGDTETYLMMAKVDKAYIRKEERLKAKEQYDEYEEQLEKKSKLIMILSILVALLVVIILIAYWSTLSVVVLAIYAFLSEWAGIIADWVSETYNSLTS